MMMICILLFFTLCVWDFPHISLDTELERNLISLIDLQKEAFEMHSSDLPCVPVWELEETHCGGISLSLLTKKKD